MPLDRHSNLQRPSVSAIQFDTFDEAAMPNPAFADCRRRNARPPPLRIRPLLRRILAHSPRTVQQQSVRRRSRPRISQLLQPLHAQPYRLLASDAILGSADAR